MERFVHRLNREWNVSVSIAPHELSSLRNAERSLDETSLLSVSAVLDSDGRNFTIASPTRSLVETFFEISQSSKPTDILDTVLRYALACNDALDGVDAWQRFAPHNLWLAEEADTWRLLHALLTDSPDGQQTDATPLSVDDALSPKKLIANYFLNDREVRSMQLVVDWLEACAAYRDSIVPMTARVGGSLHWENTLHRLINGDSLFDSTEISDLITEMDPDAPRRQNKTVHSLDRRDDDNLCRRIFREIRCGRFEEAVSLCVDCGQMWRAIILQGHRLLDYPELPAIDSKFPIIGNSSRDLWKWCCSQYLKNPNENEHFKATLSILSGRLSSVLPLCRDSWDDSLWAHLRVQIEHRVDEFLRERLDAVSVATDDVARNMLDEAETPRELSMHQIFGEVEALFNCVPESRYREIQRKLILDEVESLIRRISLWINDMPYDLVRFVAHLILVLRHIGKDYLREVSDNILKVFVQKLIQNSEGFSVSPELISHYVTALPLKMQIQLFSELMWLIDAKENRQKVVEAGLRAGINVQAAAIETVRFAIKLLKEKPSSALVRNSTFDNEDYEKSQKLINRIISSLEWFSYFENQIVDAVSMSNCIIRILIFKGDLDSATGVLGCLTQFCPTSVIAQNLQSASNILREHLCLKAYLEAINGYATWYRQHAGGRPKSPEPLPPDSTFTDRVHYEQIKAQIQLQREQWAAAGTHQTSHTKQQLYNVLLFPQGWLVDDAVNDENFDRQVEEFIDRENQLLSLRKLCVPEIVLLLLKVLQSGNVEGHVEAIRVTEILASENRKLYALFSKHKLREVLHKISDSSLNVLEDNRDPWGFAPASN